MYVRLIVDNLDSRILHIAEQECARRGDILRATDSIGSKTILLYACGDLEAVADLISTLETSKSAEVLIVEDTQGRRVDAYLNPGSRFPLFNRDTLTLSA